METVLAPDPTEFRRVLGHFCSGVTIITALDPDGPVGFACQSFASLSLDPPLVTFAVARTSKTWPRIEAAGAFGVNVLAGDQEQLCRRFAASQTDKFAGATWEPAPVSGSPLLTGAIAWIDCSIFAVHSGGDHWIVLGRVSTMQAAESAPDPLLFSRGVFHRPWPTEIPIEPSRTI